MSGLFGFFLLLLLYCRQRNHIYGPGHEHSETGKVVASEPGLLVHDASGIAGAFADYLMPSVASYKNEVLKRVSFKEAARRLPKAYWVYLTREDESL